MKTQLYCYLFQTSLIEEPPMIYDKEIDRLALVACGSCFLQLRYLRLSVWMFHLFVRQDFPTLRSCCLSCHLRFLFLQEWIFFLGLTVFMDFGKCIFFFTCCVSCFGKMLSLFLPFYVCISGIYFFAVHQQSDHA